MYFGQRFHTPKQKTTKDGLEFLNGRLNMHNPLHWLEDVEEWSDTTNTTVINNFFCNKRTASVV